MGALQEVVQSDEVQYCGFKIHQNHLGISVLEVQEIIRPQKITPIPMVEDHIKGLINLRGRIVTVVSLRKLFGLEDHSEEYMNIIVQNGDSLLALMVDEIMDVETLDRNHIVKAPETVDKRLKPYIEGVYKKEKGLFVLLNLSEIINY